MNPERLGERIGKIIAHFLKFALFGAAVATCLGAIHRFAIVAGLTGDYWPIVIYLPVSLGIIYLAYRIFFRQDPEAKKSEETETPSQTIEQATKDALTADSLFPVYNVTLGRTSYAEMRKLGGAFLRKPIWDILFIFFFRLLRANLFNFKPWLYYHDGELGELMFRFNSYTGIVEEAQLWRGGGMVSPMPEHWRKIGLDLESSYTAWLRWLREKKFIIEVTEPPKEPGLLHDGTPGFSATLTATHLADIPIDIELDFFKTGKCDRDTVGTLSRLKIRESTQSREALLENFNCNWDTEAAKKWLGNVIKDELVSETLRAKTLIGRASMHRAAKRVEQAIMDYTAVINMRSASPSYKFKAMDKRADINSFGGGNNPLGAIEDYNALIAQIEANSNPNGERIPWLLLKRGWAKRHAGQIKDAIMDWKLVLSRPDASELDKKYAAEELERYSTEAIRTGVKSHRKTKRSHKQKATHVPCDQVVVSSRSEEDCARETDRIIPMKDIPQSKDHQERLSQITAALNRRDVETIFALLRAHPELHSAKSSGGTTPLHVAAYCNDKDSIAQMLDEGADIEAKDLDGETPLFPAARRNAKDAAALLLARGARVNVKDKDSITPLHRAAYNNAKEAVALLVDSGADVNERNKEGGTPLHAAAIKNNKDIAALLLRRGAHVNGKDDDGKTPLHEAAYNDSKEVAMLLLDNCGDLNAKDNFGQTPVDFAKASVFIVIQERRGRH